MSASHSIVSVVVLLMLVSCTHPHHRVRHVVGMMLDERAVDSTYRSWPIRMTVRQDLGMFVHQEFPMTYHVKLFERDRKLALCGAYVAPDALIRSSAAVSAALAARDSYLLIGSEQDADAQRIWPGFFMPNRTGGPEDRRAACVVTELPWSNSYDSAKLAVHIGNLYDKY